MLAKIKSTTLIALTIVLVCLGIVVSDRQEFRLNADNISVKTEGSIETVESNGLEAVNDTKRELQYVSGDRIFEADGSETTWRGVGGSYLFHAGDRYKEAWHLHLPEIQAMGLNTIRLAFSFADSAPNPDYGVPSADVLDFEKMDWVLDFLAQHGIKGILDLHNWKDMAGDFGSQKLIDDWRVVAQHYRGDSRVAAYELFNEPASSTWAPSIRSKMDVARFYANLTDAIREVDPDRIVIWESQPYVPPLEEIVDLLRPNLVFTFHRWWTDSKWEFDFWTVEQISYMSLSYAVEYRKKLNVPFWFGEFGANSPFNASNPEWRLTEQHLWRCEEQVVGWNLWMGRTDINKPWNYYLPFFPLKIYNSNLTRQDWQPPCPSFAGYVLASKGVDRLEPYRIELWHNGDYVTLKPGIAVRVIVNRKLPNGTVEVVYDWKLVLTEETTIKNIEGTAEFPGDWNTKIFLLYYVESE
jgi:hypothetical protein